jgi:hypothetical protein
MNRNQKFLLILGIIPIAILIWIVGIKDAAAILLIAVSLGSLLFWLWAFQKSNPQKILFRFNSIFLCFVVLFILAEIICFYSLPVTSSFRPKSQNFTTSSLILTVALLNWSQSLRRLKQK